MVGGQFVSHPGGGRVRYMINVSDSEDPLFAGIDDFDVVSEQHYLHVDPAARVLATTKFPVADGPHVPNGQVDVPVVWTKYYGQGRVYYCSLGHTPETVPISQVSELMARGMLWAAN